MNKNMKNKILKTLALSLTASMVFSAGTYAANPSRAEVSQWLNSQLGNSFDTDGQYGAQCTDWVNAYFNTFWNENFSGIAISFKDNPMPLGWKIQPYFHGLVPKVGDVVVGIGGYFDSTNGHVAIVKSANQNTLETYDQNFGNHTYVEVFGNHDYNGITHIITPIFGDEASYNNTNTTSNTSSPSNSSNSKGNNKIQSTSESGTHIFDKYSYIRNQPLANATVIAHYNKGDKVFYDQKLTNDGYRWISYISYGGNRRYVAIEKLVNDNNQNQETTKKLAVLPKTVNKTFIVKNESGTYYFKDTRPIKPTYDINSETLAEYQPGMSVNHDQKIIANGYEWLSYIGYSGNRRYIPIKNISGLGGVHVNEAYKNGEGMEITNQVETKEKTVNLTVEEKPGTKEGTMNVTVGEKAEVKEETANVTVGEKAEVKEETANLTVEEKPGTKAEVKEETANVTAEEKPEVIK